MVLRGEAIAQIGHFDEALGPGARFRSCNDVDLTYRLLVSGARVMYSPQVLVYHQQRRSLRQVMARERDYALGAGAFLVKHLRCGDFYVGRMLFDRLWTYGLRLAWTRVGEESGRVSRRQALLYFSYKAYCGLVYTVLGAWWGLRWSLSHRPRLYLVDSDVTVQVDTQNEPESLPGSVIASEAKQSPRFFPNNETELLARLKRNGY